MELSYMIHGLIEWQILSVLHVVILCHVRVVGC